jgi:hypothetical protein
MNFYTDLFPVILKQIVFPVSIAGGSVFYNGDIVLDKELAKVIYSNMTSARYKRATTRNPRTWRNAIVPYMFASDIGNVVFFCDKLLLIFAI